MFLKTRLYKARAGVLNSFCMPVENGQRPDKSQLNPMDIYQLKDFILAAWDTLPPEHQATMTLVLLENTLKSEWGEWSKDAIERGWVQEQAPTEKTFPVISLSRSALTRAFDEEEAGRFSDQQIARLAEEMGIGFNEDPGFWYSVEMIGRRLFGDDLDFNQVETNHRAVNSESGFSDWIQAVDDYAWVLAGCSVHDLSDCDFRSMFEEGVSPEEMTNEVLQDAGLGLDE